jgi:YVTN family beta-propeller protein
MPPPGQGTVLATLMFTDIVGSSELAEELGDRRWHELLARHHAITRRELKRFNGRELDTAGDGFFAAFTRPAEAVRCAAAIVDGVRELGIEIRVGLHVGEAEVFGSKLSGTSVHIAARTMAMASAGQILVTGVLRDLIPGAGIALEDRGIHQLKGVPGDWRLFEVVAIEHQARPAPAAAGAARERRDRIQAPFLPRKARSPLMAGGAVAVIALAVVGFLVTRSTPTPAVSPGSSPSSVGGLPTFSLVRIDATARRIVGTIKLPGRPSAVLFAEGSVWVADTDADAVLRIDPASGRITSNIKVGKEPSDLAFGNDAIWVADKLSSSVSRINPGTNHVVATIPVGESPRSVAANDKGVWVTTGLFVSTSPPHGVVTRIDPIGNKAVHDEQFIGTCSPSVSANGDAVFVASIPGSVWRMDPRTDARTKVADIHAVAAWILAEEDALWVASDGLPAKIFPIDPATGEVSPPTAAGVTTNGGGPGCVPIRLASGAGDIWVPNLEDRSISVIARLSRDVIATIPLQGRPAGIAFGLDTVWVAVDAR